MNKMYFLATHPGRPELCPLDLSGRLNLIPKFRDFRTRIQHGDSAQLKEDGYYHTYQKYVRIDLAIALYMADRELRNLHWGTPKHARLLGHVRHEFDLLVQIEKWNRIQPYNVPFASSDTVTTLLSLLRQNDSFRHKTYRDQSIPLHNPDGTRSGFFAKHKRDKQFPAYATVTKRIRDNDDLIHNKNIWPIQLIPREFCRFDYSTVHEAMASFNRLKPLSIKARLPKNPYLRDTDHPGEVQEYVIGHYGVVPPSLSVLGRICAYYEPNPDLEEVDLLRKVASKQTMELLSAESRESQQLTADIPDIGRIGISAIPNLVDEAQEGSRRPLALVGDTLGAYELIRLAHEQQEHQRNILWDRELALLNTYAPDIFRNNAPSVSKAEHEKRLTLLEGGDKFAVGPVALDMLFNSKGLPCNLHCYRTAMQFARLAFRIAANYRIPIFMDTPAVAYTHLSIKDPDWYARVGRANDPYYAGNQGLLSSMLAQNGYISKKAALYVPSGPQPLYLYPKEIFWLLFEPLRVSTIDFEAEDPSPQAVGTIPFGVKEVIIRPSDVNINRLWNMALIAKDLILIEFMQSRGVTDNSSGSWTQMETLTGLARIFGYRDIYDKQGDIEDWALPEVKSYPELQDLLLGNS